MVEVLDEETRRKTEWETTRKSEDESGSTDERRERGRAPSNTIALSLVRNLGVSGWTIT